MPFGRACGAPAAYVDVHAAAGARHMLPGGTLEISAIGRENTTGVLMIGTRRLSPSIPLDALGAPGCSLYVAADLALPASHGRSLDRDGFSQAAVGIRLPGNPTVLGARFLAQWIDVESGKKSNALGLTTTNGVDIKVGTSLPPGRIATVTSRRVKTRVPFPAVGRVEVSRAPVIRFEYR